MSDFRIWAKINYIVPEGYVVAVSAISDTSASGVAELVGPSIHGACVAAREDRDYRASLKFVSQTTLDTKGLFLYCLIRPHKRPFTKRPYHGGNGTDVQNSLRFRTS